MSIFNAQFSTGQVTEATGVTNTTLQSWLKRGVIVGQKDAPISGGGSPGAHRRFSFFNVMEIAIAKELIDVGLRDLDHAFKAARHFAHVGQGPMGPSHPVRMPSCPFDGAGKSATTVIAAREDQSVELLYEVGTDQIPIIWDRLGGRGGFILIDAERVFDRTVSRLGYEPRDVMAQVYRPTS